MQILERRTVVKRDDQDWRLDYLWTPKISPEPVELWNHNGLVEDGLFQEDDGVPIQVCTWGLEGDNRRLTSIWSSIYDLCHIASLTFNCESGNGEESAETIGDIGPMMMMRNAPHRWDQGGSGLTADFDDGENITGLEVQISQGLIVGLKVSRNMMLRVIHH